VEIEGARCMFRNSVNRSGRRSLSLPLKKGGRLRVSADTHVGKVRQRNEDRLLVDEKQSIFAVADGMGGHSHGDLCASLCVDYLHKFFKRSVGASSQSVKEDLRVAIRLVNVAIKREVGKERRLVNAGSTLVACALVQGSVVWGNVGDSRLYLVKPAVSTIEQITADQGHRSMLSNCMNLTDMESFFVDTGEREVSKGDILLLCSDGLSDLVPDAAILETVCEALSQGLDAATEALIGRALKEGGRDNITTVLIEVS